MLKGNQEALGFLDNTVNKLGYVGPEGPPLGSEGLLSEERPSSCNIDFFCELRSVNKGDAAHPRTKFHHSTLHYYLNGIEFPYSQKTPTPIIKPGKTQLPNFQKQA